MQALAGLNVGLLLIWFIYIVVEWTWLKPLLGWAIGSSLVFNFVIWKGWLK